MPGTSFHKTVSLDGQPKPDWHYTVKLNGTIVQADVGKAVSMHSAANTFKLAANDDVIVGRLEFLETDAAGVSTGHGTVAFQFIDTLPVKTGETVVVGGSVLGAGAGEVKPNGTTDLTDNIVLEVRSGFAVVYKR